ncbi:MAG: hypothetical protein WCA64_03225 [Gallionella sp.]
MSVANEYRTKIANALLAIGLFLQLFGSFMSSSWGLLAIVSGTALFAFGALMTTSLSIIKVAPCLIQKISRHTEPVWDGELLHTDGSEFKIRYGFNHQGSPWFVASDVCIAVGTKVPPKGSIKWGGVPLFIYGKHVCFSEKHVQDYLIPLAIKNHAANRLLLNIRNNILRKLDKQRELQRGR